MSSLQIIHQAVFVVSPIFCQSIFGRIFAILNLHCYLHTVTEDVIEILHPTYDWIPVSPIGYPTWKKCDTAIYLYTVIENIGIALNK